MSEGGIEDRLRTRFGRRRERLAAVSTIATYTGRKIGYSKGAGSKEEGNLRREWLFDEGVAEARLEVKRRRGYRT